MKDFKTMTVPPDLEAEAISLWQSFGYELFNNQEVLSKDTHVEQSTMDILCDTYSQVTETIHYIKLSFQRESTIPNYQELKQLEYEFEHIPTPGDPPSLYSLGTILFGLCLFTIPGIFMLVSNFRYPKKMKEYNIKFGEYAQKRDAIAERAARLCV